MLQVEGAAFAQRAGAMCGARRVSHSAGVARRQSVSSPGSRWIWGFGLDLRDHTAVEEVVDQRRAPVELLRYPVDDQEPTW